MAPRGEPSLSQVCLWVKSQWTDSDPSTPPHLPPNWGVFPTSCTLPPQPWFRNRNGAACHGGERLRASVLGSGAGH